MSIIKRFASASAALFLVALCLNAHVQIEKVSAFSSAGISLASKTTTGTRTSTATVIATPPRTRNEATITRSALSMSSMAIPMLPEGLAKTVVNGGETGASPIGRGDIVTVKYTCYSAGLGDQDENEASNVLLARSDSQKVVVGDGSMVPGWDAALRSMTVGERAVVRITDPSLAYGNAKNDPRGAAALAALLGVDTDLASTARLEFDIQVLGVQSAAQAAQIFDMNFDAMALEDDTPKTAEEIAAAYQVRMANKAPEKEGLEGWIDTVKNYYFFGFFEGETGEEAPWYLKPSITFPIAFAVVGAAFWVSLLSGAISEKGAQSVDELDVLVTTSMMTVTTLLAGFPSV
mmetsp:Transcript_11005/g.23334  ORF Transcript_11005/g.23334 Transcript_11005/m.23334 type:complete len:348 (+) Transcript_11005:238-1281(+)|eukprot:CAMPEP_0168195704 /NCGR_PEP_ID=MMETSP0139_2-20121125/20017_1 /TAXON_ID=44445 /ORGANISM="Pseudo-nitzschia australis, Strain 10249 10 AB" /LENGTH=347 /DNA_ID=CAMNT_0008119615 /DNA_START=186 /DNA_END=1229 /DNA_ORIENTATION=-